jgi:hypothetical protein
MPRGRKPSIRFHPDRKAYTAFIRGQQHTLANSDKDDSPSGPGYLAALKRFRELLEADTEGTLNDIVSIRTLVKHYLADCAEMAAIQRKTECLELFAEDFGNCAVRDLRPDEVDEWVKDRESHRFSQRPTQGCWENLANLAKRSVRVPRAEVRLFLCPAPW